MEDLQNIILKKNTLFFSAVGATMIILGSVMIMDDTVETNVGNMLFLGGWVVFLFSILNKERRSMWSYGVTSQGTMTQTTFMGVIGGMLIVFSELLLQQTEQSPEGLSELTSSTPGIISLIGWVIISLAISSEPGYYRPRGQKMIVAVPSVMMIIYALLVALPQQLRDGNPLGVGIPLFTLGWVGLSVTNSMILPKLESNVAPVVEETKE